MYSSNGGKGVMTEEELRYKRVMIHQYVWCGFQI